MSNRPGLALLQRLRVLVASPGYVRRERDHVSALAEELNRGVAAQAGFVLEVVRYETRVSPSMGRTQQVVFDQIGAVDIFVGIMWRRFATPPQIAAVVRAIQSIDRGARTVSATLA